MSNAAETSGFDEGTAPKGRRVLVAEDSPITHDLLKLLLKQRGHAVDITTDGEQALVALNQNDYDVALLDFHLPKMDGLQVAAAIRNWPAGRRRPRLVAITADVEGLLAHTDGCDNFDHVIPKPLDIYQVGQVVEQQAGIADLQDDKPASPALTVLPGGANAGSSPFESLGYEFLSWPGDIDGKHLSAHAMQATLGDQRFDGILLKMAVSADDLVAIWNAKALFALPIIDTTGTLGRMADIDGSKLNARDADRLGSLLRDFQDRRARLHRDLLFSDNREEQLLGRIYVANQPLAPAYDPRFRELVSYNVALPPGVALREAEALCDSGLLKKSFYDRFHLCPRCDSFRLHVREECSQCHSSHLEEQQYLHHFRCAFQGPEEDFRKGDQLVCPKCRHELTHFGFDYDRPGAMIVCESCHHAASEPSVGFVCLDCGAHVDAEVASTRDIYAYELSTEGLRFAEHGSAIMGYARQTLRFADLPVELIVALNTAAKRYNEENVPFTLVNILYQNQSHVIAEDGARAFAQARELFLENLRALLDGADTVVKGPSHDFALLEGIAPEQARVDFDAMSAQASAAVRCDLGVMLQGFGAQDFS